jgi:hypothetical protein
MAQNTRVYRLLALCAHVELGAAHRHRLARRAARLTAQEWESVPTQAETHGMAPLLYVHLKAAEVQLPRDVKRTLQGLVLRHREINRVRMRVLRDILSTYDDAGIQALVLKGAALAHLVYPEPGLRPMSDLDILVPKAELWRAQRLLAESGFDAPLPSSRALPHRHLGGATRRTEGLTIHVELHYKLSSDYFDHAISYMRSKIWPKSRSSTPAHAFRRRHISRARSRQAERRRNAPASMWPDDLTVPPQPFVLADLTAHTLGHEDMLSHLCQHLTSHVNVWDFGRLIWVADIVSLAERFVAQIDWKRIRRQRPAVLRMLSLLHFMTPLSDELLSRAGVRIGRAPEGIGVEYQGWLRTPGADWRERGYWPVLRETLFPSEWWLRLRYKLGSVRPLFWHRWIRHPLYILGHVGRVLLEKLGWPKPLELAGQRTPEVT